MENQQAPVMSTKDWVITILITAIPVVGIVMLFVWAFGSGENPNKSNWAKAYLIWAAIAIVLVCLLWVTIFAAFYEAMKGSGGF